MKSFLLLFLLSLMAGCECSSEVKGCPEGWIEFTCKYPKTNGIYQRIDVVNPTQTSIPSIKKDEWETNGSVSLYHDTKTRQLKVAIKQLKNSEEYECKFYPKAGSSEEEQQQNVKVTTRKDGCQKSFHQTAYKKAKTTITCHYPRNTHKSSVKFFCKENDSTCEEILSTKSSPNSNGTFTLTQSNSGFNMSISRVSSQDAGVYCCGVKSNDGSYRASIRKIHLEVKDITTFKRFPTVGQNFTYWCEYPNRALTKRFVCKGEDPSLCEHLVSTAQLSKNTRFSMKENKEKRNFTITVREVTTDDSGTYWCGADGFNQRNLFFNRLLMTVVPTAPPTSPGTDGRSQIIITGIVCVSVLLLLLFALIFTLIYKRLSHSKNTRNGAAAEHIREDYVYEEIQERAQKPDAVRTIYATANFPTNPSASLHYTTVRFQNSSDKGGEALIHKPRSACEYSTVKQSQSTTYCTVNEPSRPSEEPLYSTIDKPQWQRGKISPVRKF